MTTNLLKTKVLLVLFVVFVAMGFAQAQERTISGKVTDKQSGETLIGVNVTYANDPSKGTVTDIDGNYQLVVPEDVTALTFSYVGYSSQTIEITADVINVQMVAGEQLEEVVVIGYGSQSAKEVTSAVTSVKAEDFNQGNINDPVQLIQGKVAGLSIAKPGNDPNSTYNIRLRGLSTFGSNTEPLIIIDGVQGADLNSVDPDDIASMDVLKDASATAIYGTQGASGVIIITTKKGEFVPDGQTFNVNFNTALTTESVDRRLDVLSHDDYLSMPNAVDYEGSTDWMDQLIQSSVSQAYNLSVDGATESSNYRVAFNYRKADGVVLGTGFERFNGRVNFTKRALQDKLTLDFNLSATNRNETYSPNEAFGAAVKYNPTANVMGEDDFSQEWGGYFQREAFGFFNPRAMIEQSTMDGKKMDIMGSVKGTYEIIQGLKFSLFYSQNYESDVYGSYWSKNAFYTPYALGSHKGFANKSNNNRFNHLFESILSYEKQIGGLKFKALGGYSFREDYFDNLWVHGEGFLTDEFSYHNLGSASENKANSESFGSYKESSRIVGLFGRVSANWRETAFLTANFRRDGSSKFGVNNKWGNFGGISAGVDFAKLFEMGVVDRLKLRGGYGTVGNLPYNSYLSKNNYKKISDEFFYNGGFIQAYAPVLNDNPDLKWEVKKEMNIGVDFFLFNYRVGGTIDYYSSTSSDLILYAQVRVPPYPSDRMWLNLGELENSGLEFALNIKAIEKKDFSWSTDLNFTKYFDTKLTKITSDLTTSEGTIHLGFLGAPYFTGISTIVATEGEVIGQIMAPIYVGLDSAGVMQFESRWDSIESTSNPEIEDYQNVGNGLPKFQFGWNNSFKYKNLDISFFIRGVFGHYLVNINNARYGNPNVIGIQSGMNQALDYIDAKSGPIYSDVHVEKADYVKLDNFTIGYNFLFPESKYIRKLRLYVSGQNLFTITNYSGVSPEVRYGDAYDNNNPLAPGLDRENTYFTTRSFTFGVNVNF